MSRSGYNEDGDDDQWGYIRSRGMIASATRGKRGQQLLRDILIGMNAMPVKRLVKDDLEKDGEVCAIGAAGKLRGKDMSRLDPEDYDSVSGEFNVAPCLAQEIVYMNDESGWSGEYEFVDESDTWGRHIYGKIRPETPEERYERMRKWVRSQISDPLFDVVWC